MLHSHEESGDNLLYVIYKAGHYAYHLYIFQVKENQNILVGVAIGVVVLMVSVLILPSQ